jgi:universal stress protein A
MKKLKRILAPTDFSEFGKAALKCACDFAEQFGAELHLLNVVEDYAAYYPDTTMMATAEFTFDMQSMLADAGKMLDQVPGDWGKDLTIVRSTEIGTPASGILRYAKEHEIDLIVVSTHGRTGLMHLLLGSVAEKIVRRAPCLVLTVRPEGFEIEDEPVKAAADVGAPADTTGESDSSAE